MSTIFDVELAFKTGQVLTLTVTDGRDTLARLENGLLRIVIRHSPDEERELICQQADLAYSDITKRRLEAEDASTLIDPQTKVSGDLPRVQ